jgi:hypothetical protein
VISSFGIPPCLKNLDLPHPAVNCCPYRALCKQKQQNKLLTHNNQLKTANNRRQPRKTRKKIILTTPEKQKKRLTTLSHHQPSHLFHRTGGILAALLFIFPPQIFHTQKPLSVRLHQI